MNIYSGTVLVTKPGRPVQVPHKGNVKHVTFKAGRENKGDSYIGAADVSKRDGMTLAPGESIQIPLATEISISQFWVDAAMTHNRVDYLGSV